MNIKEYIEKNGLLFDGAMGTYYSLLNKKVGAGCELASLSQPELISRIHREYIEVGCKAIKTNTFNVNRIVFQQDEDLVKRCIDASCAIAKEYEDRAYIFADIGPIDTQKCFEEYKFVVDLFLENGMKYFLFETHSNTNGLKEIARYIKDKNPESFIIMSFAIQPDGYSRDGYYIQDIFDDLKQEDKIDSIGLNCLSGAYHMNKLIETIDTDGILLSLMPNAGYPIVLNSRTFYDGNPEYYAMQLNELAKHSQILGGCCGTTPQHMKEVVSSLSNQIIEKNVVNKEKVEVNPSQSPFWKKLENHKKVIAVELDPPEHTSLSKFMAGAWQLKGAGIDIITIADCPVGRVRMDSSLLACKIQRELSIEALPHMTCRDRNINATKALLMGTYAEGIRNVLLVTGDPIPTAQKDEVKSVYQFNSRLLARYINSIRKQNQMEEFHLFGALNVNALNFDMQLRLAKEKLENGMVGFLTQPVLTERGFENLKRAKQELNCILLGGVIPVVSKRNALFMNSEINGIDVDSKIIELYADKSRSECEQLAVDISVRIMKEMNEYVDGFYLMTPFGRVSLIEKIIKEYKKNSAFISQ